MYDKHIYKSRYRKSNSRTGEACHLVSNRYGYRYESVVNKFYGKKHFRISDGQREIGCRKSQ